MNSDKIVLKESIILKVIVFGIFLIFLSFLQNKLVKACLIAFYQFEANANDSSGNGNHGTINGATLTGSGFQGSAFQFDGVDDFIEIPVNINPAVLPQITIGAWVKSNVNKVAEEKKARQVISHDDGGFDRSLGMDVRSGGGEIPDWSSFTGSGVLSSGIDVTVGEWIFLAVVYGQSTVRLHVNNSVFTDSGTPGSGWSTTRIGSNPSFGEFFNGKIDNVFIFSEALSISEVENIRNNPSSILANISNCEIILDGIENFISCNVTNPQSIGIRGCPAGTLNISVDDINKVFAEPSTLDFPDTQTGEKFMNFNYKSTDIIGKTNVDFSFNSFDEETSTFTFCKTVSKPIEVFCPVSVPSCISEIEAIGLSLDGPDSGRKIISLDCTDSCPTGTLETRGNCDSNQDIATCQVFESSPTTVDIEFAPISEGQTTAIVDIQCIEPLTDEQGITSELEITAITNNVFRVTVSESEVSDVGCFTSNSSVRLTEGDECDNVAIQCNDCLQSELQNISSLITCDVDDPSIASCTPILFPGAPLNPEVSICPLSAGSTSITVNWSCGPNRAFGGTEITASGEINIDVTVDEEIIIPEPKLFTFDCGEALQELPFFGMEMLTMGVGESKDCTLKVINLEPGIAVNVSTKLRKGIRSSIKVEPINGVTDDKGEIEITITALRKGINWAAWAVPNDEGEFEFNKRSYDTGLAWGMFVEVK